LGLGKLNSAQSVSLLYQTNFKISRPGRKFVLRVRQHLLIRIWQQLLTGTVRPTTYGGPLYTVSARSATPRRAADRTRFRARGAAAAAAVALLVPQARPRRARSRLDRRGSLGGHCAARVARTKSENDGGARAPCHGGGERSRVQRRPRTF
jgi:hypothetical protein